MADIGAFTPAQAQALWQDYLSRKQLPAQQTKHYPQRPPIVETSPHRVFCKNTETEVIPPFACMRIIGVEDVGNRTALKVEKPTSTTGHFLFNGPYEIPVDVTEVIEGETVVTEPGVGWGYRHGIVLMLGDVPASVGAEYSPIVGSWEIEEDSGPFIVFGRDQTTPQALVGRFASGGEGGGGEKILFEIIRPLRGVGLDCNAMECAVLNVACGMISPQIGDVVAVYDELGCVFNAPELLLTGVRGYAVNMGNPDYGNDPLTISPGTEGIEEPEGDCRWSVDTLCCVEEDG